MVLICMKILIWFIPQDRGSKCRRKRSRMSVAVEAQSTMVEVVLAEAAMALSMDLPAEAVPGHSAALTVVPIPEKRQILMMYMTTTIRMILQKSGQRTLETEIMMTDMKMPMTTGKMNMMIKIFTLLPLWGFVRELREERA